MSYKSAVTCNCNVFQSECNSLSFYYTFTSVHPTTLSPSRSVEQLDLDKGWWVMVEPMLSRRSTLGVAVLNGELYAVGGFDGTNGLDTVEKYNPGKGVWTGDIDLYTHVSTIW